MPLGGGLRRDKNVVHPVFTQLGLKKCGQGVVFEVAKPHRRSAHVHQPGVSHGSCVNPARRMPFSVAHFCVCDQQMRDAGVAATGAWITHDPYHAFGLRGWSRIPPFRSATGTARTGHGWIPNKRRPAEFVHAKPRWVRMVHFDGALDSKRPLSLSWTCRRYRDTSPVAGSRGRIVQVSRALCRRSANRSTPHGRGSGRPVSPPAPVRGGSGRLHRAPRARWLSIRPLPVLWNDDGEQFAAYSTNASASTSTWWDGERDRLARVPRPVWSDDCRAGTQVWCKRPRS